MGNPSGPRGRGRDDAMAPGGGGAAGNENSIRGRIEVGEGGRRVVEIFSRFKCS
jgi:hypothetical protein